MLVRIAIPGWGFINDKMDSPDKLQEVLISIKDCKDFYTDGSKTDSMICAIGPKKDSCDVI